MRRTARHVAAVAALVLCATFWTPSAWAVGNTEAAKRAGTFVASQASTITDATDAADALLALAASGNATVAPTASTLLTVLRDGAGSASARSPESAAKVTVAAVAFGLDPRNLAGTNVLDKVTAGIHSDGSFGSQMGASASAWGLIALTRAGVTVPAPMLRYLVKSANPDGGFGASTGQPSDALSTGLALLGLASQTDSISARDAAKRAVDWSLAQQQANGSWTGDSTVAATAALASALQEGGLPQPRAVQFLVGAQSGDGSFVENGRPQLPATELAAMLLGGTSPLSASGANISLAGPKAPGPDAGTPTSASSAGPTQAPDQPTESPTQAPGGLKDDGNNVLWVLLPILLLAMLGGAYYWMSRPHPQKSRTKRP